MRDIVVLHTGDAVDELVERLCLRTMKFAEEGRGPEDTLRMVLATAGYQRRPLELALATCRAQSEEEPTDEVAERAAELLRSALHTGIFAER